MVFRLRILVFFATDTPGDFSPSCWKHPLLKLQTRLETSQPPRQTYQLFVTTNGLEFVSLSRLKHLILLPLTQLEMSRHPCKNIMFVSPQTQYQANKRTRWNDVLSPLTPPSPPLHLQTWTVHHEHSMWYISWQVSYKILGVISKMLSENLYDDPVSVLLWLSWSTGQPLRDSHQKTVAHQPKTGRIIISMFLVSKSEIWAI